MKIKEKNKMDYTKLKKEELIKLLEENQEVVEKAKFHQDEYLAAKKLREEAVKEAYQNKKQLRDLEQKVEQAQKEKEVAIKSIQNNYNALDNRFDALAKLFDEYIKTFDDQHRLFETISRNTSYVIRDLKGKIQQFNGQAPVEGDENK